MPELRTTYGDSFDQFAKRSRRARQLVDGWRSDPHHAEVVPFVESHRTNTLYRLSNEDVRVTCEATEHALGDVKRAVAEGVVAIRDWHPSFAFIHVFHYALESEGSLPTYQRFRQLTSSDPFLENALLQPAQKAVESAIRTGVTADAARDAMRWRVGNAYYSFLREVYTIVMLRSMGLDIRYHVLPDALFAVDCWHDQTAISLFIGNPRFKDGISGRKSRAEGILSDATPPLRFVDIRLPVTHVFGQAHLPPAKAVEAVAKDLGA